jgi:hypothetical protein
MAGADGLIPARPSRVCAAFAFLSPLCATQKLELGLTSLGRESAPWGIFLYSVFTALMHSFPSTA